MIIIYTTFKSTISSEAHKDVICGTDLYVLYLHLPETWDQEEMIGTHGQLEI